MSDKAAWRRARTAKGLCIDCPAKNDGRTQRCGNCNQRLLVVKRASRHPERVPTFEDFERLMGSK